MSLQAHGLRRILLRSVFVSGLRGVTTGILLFAAAIACGADVAGPKAEGFKEIAPASLWLSKKTEDKTRARDIEANVRKIINGAPIAGFETPFDNYFAMVLFPQWTQPTEENLNDLPKARDGFLKNYVEASGRNPDAHSRLIDLTHRELSKIVKDEGFHPAVRYNAILVIGMLNEVEPNRGTGTKQMPEPYILALSTLTEELKKPGNNEAVRVGALLGVSRHLEWNNSKAAMSPTRIQPAVLKEILDELTSIVSTKTPPAGRSPEGQVWLRRRALEALGHANVSKVDPAFATLLEGIIGDDAEPISVRCTAAEVMSHLDYQAPATLSVPTMAKNLGYLALYACHSELLRLERLKKKDEELAKMSGGGGGGGGMMPGGGAGGAGMAPPGGAGGAGMAPPGGAGGAGMAPPGGAGGAGMAPPGGGGGAGRRGGGMMPNVGGAGKDVIYDPKGYRVDYSKRRLRAELYAVQLALGKKKDPNVKGLLYHAKEPEKQSLKVITDQVEEVIRTVEELKHSAENYEKDLRKEMKKLEALTRPLPVAAKVGTAKADATKGPAVPADEVPAAKPAAAKPAAEDPAEEVPAGPPAAKGPAEPAKGAAPAAPADGAKGPPAAPADAGKAAAPPAAGKAPPVAPAGK